LEHSRKVPPRTEKTVIIPWVFPNDYAMAVPLIVAKDEIDEGLEIMHGALAVPDKFTED
jgi:hypothetical protein